MNWKLKSFIQRSCAALPFGSEPLYYAIQRNFGNLRRAPDPKRLLSGVATLEETLQRHGLSFNGKRVFEVGTGRRLDMPIGFFLLGAKSIVTVDLHRYLRSELVAEALEQIRAGRAAILAMFEPLAASQSELNQRLDQLCRVAALDDLVRLIRLEYQAPADAANTNLPDASIDLHVSYTVFEHIPANILEDILKESSRLLGRDGVALHQVDMSDHFAHSDPTLSMIHFLRYSGQEYAKYNDNQFAYCNRLRADAYDGIYERAGHNIIGREPHINAQCRASLDAGFPLAAEFAGIDKDIVATTVVRYLSRPR
jgi:hypothetical protein